MKKLFIAGLCVLPLLGFSVEEETGTATHTTEEVGTETSESITLSACEDCSEDSSEYDHTGTSTQLTSRPIRNT
jgi:hypothetical protein